MAAGLRTKKALVLFKLNTGAYGAATTPTAPLNAILANVTDPQPVMAEYADRNNIQPYFGNKGSVIVADHSEFTMEVELASSGAAGTGPAWSPLLQACGVSETLVASTSATYALISDAIKDAEIQFFLDGVKHQFLGCRGTASIEVAAKGIPMLKFKFVGLRSTISDAAVPTNADFSAFKDPLGVNFANTPTFALHGYAAVMKSLSIDFGNQTPYRNLVGKEEVSFTDRKMTGSVVVENTLIATKDWWSAVRAGTLGALSLIHGVAAGSIIELAGSNVKLKDPKTSEEDGVSMLTMALDFQPTSVGNDELTLIAR